ncbi:MAG: ComF family protein [Candidatus Yonathbacteria bacterium]|nr:ComF family protein [Candidatus Yonathbacteria bacterium]
MESLAPVKIEVIHKRVSEIKISLIICFYLRASEVDIVPSYIHMHLLLSIFTRLIDAVFPSVCGGCGKSGGLLCADCIANVPSASPATQSFITAVFDYQNPIIRGVIWKFKYKNARGVAKYFGMALYDEIIGEIGDDIRISKNEVFLLVPIPLHAKRLRERGYNQSELLAREIIKYAKEQGSEKMFKLAPGALTRTRATKPQAKSEKRSTRFENLRGAFFAFPELVRGKHIILIDDVTTTGATLTSARKTLLKNGTKTVRAYAVAH